MLSAAPINLEVSKARQASVSAGFHGVEEAGPGSWGAQNDLCLALDHVPIAGSVAYDAQNRLCIGGHLFLPPAQCSLSSVQPSQASKTVPRQNEDSVRMT